MKGKTTMIVELVTGSTIETESIEWENGEAHIIDLNENFEIVPAIKIKSIYLKVY